MQVATKGSKVVQQASVAIPLYCLVLLMPLEPPVPAFRALGVEFTVLEVAAAMALITVALSLVRSGRLEAIGQLPLAGWALAFLAACFLSTAFAQPPRLLPFKFSLRVAAGVTAFVLASVALRGTARIARLMSLLALAGTSVALVGIAEALRLPGARDLVAFFRSQTFEVGGSLRVASTFNYPNTAAGFWVLALAGALLMAFNESSSRWVRSGGVAAILLMFTALVLTYSRGALFAAFFIPVPFALWGIWQQRPTTRRKAYITLAGFLLLAGVVTLGKESHRLRTVSEGDETWYRAEFESGVRELSLETGELARTRVVVRNAGMMAWESEGAKRFHLSYRWFDLGSEALIDLVDLEGERTPLPKEVEPGERIDLLAYVRAPSEEGRYLLIWDMVQEHTTWFSEKGSEGEFLRVTVGSPSAPKAKTGDEVVNGLVLASWRPGRLELWSLAVSLFAQNPIVGVGPDNFRWRYGAAAGRPSWDKRTFSNSLYLEILSTTGIVGATAFFGLLATAVFALWRLNREPGSSMVTAALAASIGGFLVHGLFDYLLEFTSVYLVFWILMGALSAAVSISRTEGVWS